MSDLDHHPQQPAAQPPVPCPRPARGGAVRPWARAIDGGDNPILEMSEEQIARLERRLGRAIDV